MVHRVESRGEACGKVILIGEHAVVYGVPAIAVGIDRGARARVTPQGRGPNDDAGRDVVRSTLYVGGWDITVHLDREEDAKPKADLARALRGVLDASGVEHAVHVEAESDLPPASGLGCSAAMAVAIARAVDPLAPDDVIQARAMAWERVFHGNPSGVDAAVATFGGCVSFRKGHGITPVRQRASLTLCVGHTGVASSTKSMVDAVAQLRARRPEVVEKAFEGIRALAENARLAIEAGDRVALGRLMDLNQMILSGLFVSTPEIEQMCDLARKAGALGAKLTGAGGGGSVVALVGPGGADRVLQAWHAAGLEAFAATVAARPLAPGLRAKDGASESAP